MTIKILYLSGNSYPKDEYIRHELSQRLPFAMDLIEFVTPWKDRKTHLKAYLKAYQDQRLILIGRSSGARLATLAASLSYHPQIAGVIAINYPFQPPNKPDAPKRYLHLATFPVPGLIVQGIADEYGGKDQIHKFPLSDSISIKWVNTTHGMHITAEDWQEVADAIQSFVQARTTKPHVYNKLMAVVRTHLNPVRLLNKHSPFAAIRLLGKHEVSPR